MTLSKDTLFWMCVLVVLSAVYTYLCIRWQQLTKRLNHRIEELEHARTEAAAILFAHAEMELPALVTKEIAKHYLQKYSIKGSGNVQTIKDSGIHVTKIGMDKPPVMH